MSEQNRYQIECSYQTAQGQYGWVDKDGETADTWRNAIQKRLDTRWDTDHTWQVVAETPSGDGRSGSIEIQYYPPLGSLLGAILTATLIEED